MPYGGALRRLWHSWARKYPEATLEYKNSAHLPSGKHISIHSNCLCKTVTFWEGQGAIAFVMLLVRLSRLNVGSWHILILVREV